MNAQAKPKETPFAPAWAAPDPRLLRADLPSRRQNVEKGAGGFLAMQHQPPAVAIGQRQGVLRAPPFGLAYGARRGTIAAMPAPTQRHGQFARISHCRPQP